jgi:hypothetical protein
MAEEENTQERKEEKRENQGNRRRFVKENNNLHRKHNIIKINYCYYIYMNKADFSGYLKTEAFIFVNSRYDKWNKENPNNKWTEEQMAVVEKFVNGPSIDHGYLVKSIIDRIGNTVITVQVIEHLRNRFLNFLSRMFDEHHNNPEGTVFVISITSPIAGGGKKSKKYRKSRKTRKSMRRR